MRSRCSTPVIILLVFCSLLMARVSAADNAVSSTTNTQSESMTVTKTAITREAEPDVATNAGAFAANDAGNANASFRLKEDVEAHTPQQNGRSVATLLFGLFAVLAAIFGLAWLSKRFNLSLPGANSNMKLLSALSVGPKEKLLLVEVEGSKLLLGVTPQQINLLKLFDAPEVQPQQGEFSEKMLKLLQAEAGDER